MFKTGDIVDERYEIKEQIGSGGGGIIYKAYHRNMRKDVALKLIKDASAEELENRSEIDLMKDLKSRYLPIFYDFVQNGDEVYTVMEYIDGHDIKRLVEMGKNFSEDEIIKCAIQLCEAVSELHSKRPPIIHGDIKPANVMLTATGDVCLIDFNISAIMQGNKTAVKGYSKEYAAPEQTFTSKNYRQYVEKPIEDEFHEETRFLLNETTDNSDTYTKTLLDNGKETKAKGSAQAFIDFRTDIFGIGAVLYYMLTGHPPINGKPDFSDIEVSAKLERIITKAMAAIPDERYKNTEEMKADLYSKSQENYKSIPARKGNGKLFAGIACAAAAVVIFIIGCIGWKNSSSNIAVAQGKVSEVKSTTTSVTTLSIDTSVAETAVSSETTSLVTESAGFEEEFESPIVEYGFDSSLWGKLAEEIKNVIPLKYDDMLSNEKELNYYDVNASDISEFDGSFFSRGSISKHYYFDYKLPDYDNVCADGLYRVMYYVRYDNKAEWESAVNNSLDYFTYIYGESEQIDSEYFGLSGNLGYKHWVDESTAVCLDTWSNQHIMVEYVSIDAIDAEWLLPVDAGESLSSTTTSATELSAAQTTESIVTTNVTTTAPITSEITTSSEIKKIIIGGKSYASDLQSLDLSNMNLYSSNLTHLPEFTKLEKLNLSGNNLKDISPVTKIKTLRGLDISNNPKIEELPYGLLDLPDLTLLNASDTGIGGIYYDSINYTYPVNLKYINVRNTNVSFIKFSELTDGTVYYPTKFKSLIISNAPYHFLDPDRSSLSYLESFEISYESLTGVAGPKSSLEDSLSELYDLKELYIISDKKLKESQIDEIQKYINSDCKIYINKYCDFPDVLSSDY